MNIQTQRLGSLAVFALFLGVSLVSFAPTAAANHSFGSCDPHNVAPDPAHAPANTWSNHNTPRWTWSINSACAVLAGGIVGYNYVQSWGGSGTISGNSFSGSHHPTAPDGIHSLQVRTNYKYCHVHAWPFNACHVHTDGFTGYFTSASVKIDTVAPVVSISVSGGILDAGTQFVSSQSLFSIGASDERSGVASISYSIDGGAFQAYTGPFSVTGSDGAHTLLARATDAAGNAGTRSLAFVLDNTAPAIRLVTPVANSAYANGIAVETCEGDPRVSVEGAPEVPTPPVDLPSVPELPALPEAPALPEPPAVPEVVSAGPDPCAGTILRTNSITLVVPSVPEAPETPELPVTPPGPDDLPVEVPDLPEAPELPELPALPATPGSATVDAQSATFDTFIVASGTVTFRANVDDALVGTSLVEFLVDGDVVSSIAGGDGDYEFVWDTSALATGEHQASVRATDRLGNVGSLSFRVVVVSGNAPDVEAPEAPELPEVPPVPELPALPALPEIPAATRP